MVNRNRLSKSGTYNIKNSLVAVSIFLSLSIIALFVYVALENKEDLAINQQIKTKAENILQIMDLDLQKRVRSLMRIAGRWEIRNGTPQAEFESDALSYIADDPGYQAIEWVDKTFHVRWIIPLKGNEKARGLNLGFEKNRLLALEQARDQKSPTLTAPIDLVQGGKGFLVYNPIFIGDSFDGFVLAVFRTQQWLEHLAGIPEDNRQNTDYLIQISMDGISIFEDQDWDLIEENSWEQTVEIILFDHRFSIIIRPTIYLIEQSRTMLPEIVLFVSILFALLISIIVYLFQKANTARHKTLALNATLTTEITEHKNTGLLLAKERQRLEYILDGTRVGTWEWNVQTGEVVFNEQWAEMIGYSLSEISPVSIDSWMNFAHPDDLKLSGELLEKHFSKELDYYECEARMLHKDGHWIWVLDRGKVFTWTDDDKPLLMCGTHQEITARKKFEETINHLATHDALTELPNLRIAKDRIYMALKQAKRNKTIAGIMFIDLDGFKGINDNYGHDAGDYILKQTSDRLLSCVRESDTVARIGGDEFVIVLPDLKDANMTAIIADKIIKSISQSTAFKGKQLKVGASIGISLFPTNGEDLEKLLKLADNAMYTTKKSGKNGYSYA